VNGGEIAVICLTLVVCLGPLREFSASDFFHEQTTLVPWWLKMLSIFIVSSSCRFLTEIPIKDRLALMICLHEIVAQKNELLPLFSPSIFRFPLP